MPTKIGGGSRKIGRNKTKCERYFREHRREKNKIVKLSAMIKHLPKENKLYQQTKKRIAELEKEIYAVPGGVDL